MTGETVVYRNDLNLVPLRKFTSTEIDLFFSMCNKLKEQETTTLTIPFNDLKKLSNYTPTAKARFIQDLKKVYSKMLQLTYTEYSGLSFKSFVLFTSYEVHAEDEYLKIKINPDLKEILNSLTGNFTKFELEELTHIKSSYSKNMYRLLKQFKHTGHFKINIKDFKERLDIPENYRMTNINQRVLTPIIKELGFIFKNLNINKIKKGNKFEWLEFSFEPEKRIHSKRQLDMTSISKSNQNIGREMTPEWLKNNNHASINHKAIEYTEEERQAFLKRMNKNK